MSNEDHHHIIVAIFGCALSLKLEEKNKIRFGVDAIKSAPGMTKQALIGPSSILSDKKNSSTLSIRIITRAIQLRQLSIRTAF
jgi:hypothetical protein